VPKVYFDPSSSSEDVKLLPTWLRADAELPTLAAKITAAIVARFTFSTYDAPIYAWTRTAQGMVLDAGPLAGCYKVTANLYVGLRGYTPDAATAEAAFLDAMRREVANVLEWALPMAKREPNVKSESSGQGEKSVTYGERVDELFPPTFPLYLAPFVCAGVDDTFTC
jgi:hypothetical protein